MSRARLAERTSTLAALLVLACGGGGHAPGAAATPDPPPPEPYARPAYERLSDTGIYADLPGQRVARGFAPFEPAFALWSDGAVKSRYIGLPPGTTIDTSDLDHWIFPIGTRLVKEFRVDGTLVETRLIERYGEGREDYFMGAFVWLPSGDDAVLAVDAENDVLGSAHDVPSQKQCWSCHNGDAGRVLGFSALQLGTANTSASGLTVARLAATGKLSEPPDSLPPAPPGDETTAAALGYLHSNCGHCHNLHGTAWPDTQMVLRLDVGEVVAEETGIYTSLVGQKVQYFRDDAADYRVVPGHPEESAVIVRMTSRGNDKQMPPLGTEVVDDAGVARVSDWITALPAESP
jgi:hypothetical protein